MTKIEYFSALLRELHEASPELDASALASDDGMMLASHLRTGINEDRMAAMSAAMLSVGNRMVDDLLQGTSDRVMVQSSAGYIIVSAVTDELILTVVTRPDAKLGMVFHDIKNFAKQLKNGLAA